MKMHCDLEFYMPILTTCSKSFWYHFFFTQSWKFCKRSGVLFWIEWSFLQEEKAAAVRPRTNMKCGCIEDHGKPSVMHLKSWGKSLQLHQTMYQYPAVLGIQHNCSLLSSTVQGTTMDLLWCLDPHLLIQSSSIHFIALAPTFLFEMEAHYTLLWTHSILSFTLDLNLCLFTLWCISVDFVVQLSGHEMNNTVAMKSEVQCSWGSGFAAEWPAICAFLLLGLELMLLGWIL